MRTAGRLRRQQPGEGERSPQPSAGHGEAGWSLPPADGLDQRHINLLARKVGDGSLLDTTAARRALGTEVQHMLCTAWTGKPLQRKQRPPLREVFPFLPWKTDVFPRLHGAGLPRSGLSNLCWRNHIKLRTRGKLLTGSTTASAPPDPRTDASAPTSAHWDKPLTHSDNASSHQVSFI